METTIKQIPSPMYTSFTVFKKPDPQEIVETGKMLFRVSNHTKTMLSVSLKGKDWMVGVNWKVDGFNTREKKKYNIFHSCEQTDHYFVQSKHQGQQQLYDYITYLAIAICKQWGIYDQMQMLDIEVIENVVWKNYSN